MGLFTSNKQKLNWNQLNTKDDLRNAMEKGESSTILIFKHSTRCSISSMALNSFEGQWNSENDCEIYFLDLIAHRGLSSMIADWTNVEHQSPQVIVVKEGEVIYNASHSSIDAEKIGTII